MHLCHAGEGEGRGVPDYCAFTKYEEFVDTAALGVTLLFFLCVGFFLVLVVVFRSSEFLR